MPAVAAAPEKAVLAPECGEEFVVNQADCPPLAEVVQPLGKPGGVTPSKLSEKENPQPYVNTTFVIEIPVRTLTIWPMLRYVSVPATTPFVNTVRQGTKDR